MRGWRAWWLQRPGLRRRCCIGDHPFWGRGFWGATMCRQHYLAGFFPPMDEAELHRLMSEPGPFS